MKCKRGEKRESKEEAEVSRLKMILTMGRIRERKRHTR